MSRQEFEKFMIDLERVYYPLDRDQEKRNEALDIYYERLKDIPPDVMKKAIGHIFDTHERKTFR